ncbi:MAG: magnesium/cobalt transporter CorA [Candidatus Binataceae bacterium]
MFRVLKSTDGSPVKEHTGPEAVKAPEEGEFCWVDLEAFDDAELKLLQQRFGFHQLAIEDCAHRKQRAKVDEYDGYFFIIMHDMTYPVGSAGVQSEEIDSFLGERFLVTVHRKPVALISDVWKQVVSNPICASRGPDYVYYLIADAVLDKTFPIIDRFSDEILQVEKDIVERSDGGELARLLNLKRSMVGVRRTLATERDVLASLLRHGNSRIADRNLPYFRDSYDHLVRAYEQIDIERDLLGNAMDAHMSMISNRMNVIMKQLTILSAIFLPPLFITSFFGQNFTALPFDSHTLFYLEVLSCIALPVVMLYWFYRSRWL